ncbi:MAG: hypothetical protein CMB99_16315 [Flavobacteriaceae bacterium]|nr:hypothetical protein [Flavobacteriaceae bacterium]|tara:strand:- start:4586 stop:4837 length:252 start_codon:yes stop_codon:yes gene_type:complete
MTAFDIGKIANKITGPASNQLKQVARFSRVSGRKDITILNDDYAVLVKEVDATLKRLHLEPRPADASALKLNDVNIRPLQNNG